MAALTTLNSYRSDISGVEKKSSLLNGFELKKISGLNDVDLKRYRR